MYDLKKLHDVAMSAAVSAATAMDTSMPPENMRGFDCGFAWVNAPKADLRTHVGKELMALGFKKSWERGLYLWNPAGLLTQSIDVASAGAAAYADVMRQSGLVFTVGSRLD